MSYKIKETYLTIQGEGAHAGRVAIFCRFSGCNLWSGHEKDREEATCKFCDTDFVGTDGAGGGTFENHQQLSHHILSFWNSDDKPFIVFTGGEPFMNKHIIKILKTCLEKSFHVLVLTNAMQPMLNRSNDVINLRKYSKLTLRVSLDHYTKIKHELIRGKNTWGQALKGINFLNNNNFKINVASRLLWQGENENEIRVGFKNLFKKIKLNIDAFDTEQLVLFPEMNNNNNVPEITTSCWDKLKVNPGDMMCANSRMIVKRKSTEKISIVACTLLPYDKNFDLGDDLLKSHKKVYLNHLHCAKFCVLGGGNCKK